MTDTEAMNRIRELLDGQEWGADSSAEIAAVVRDTGREVHDLLDDDE